MAMIFTLIGVGAVTSQIMRGIIWLDNAGLKKTRTGKAHEKTDQTREELFQAMLKI